jgi:hypothetical protein
MSGFLITISLAFGARPSDNRRDGGEPQRSRRWSVIRHMVVPSAAHARRSEGGRITERHSREVAGGSMSLLPAKAARRRANEPSAYHRKGCMSQSAASPHIADDLLSEFSLLGGPLHRLGRRLGLVRPGPNTLPLGIALGLIPWIVLVALAALEGDRGVLSPPSHTSIMGGDPAAVLCETMFELQARSFLDLCVPAWRRKRLFPRWGPKSEPRPLSNSDPDATRLRRQR